MAGSIRTADLLGTTTGVRLAIISTAAYYLGSVIGLQLRLPPATPSVLWPPNAILTALLLFVPPRRWWVVLLGAAAAHFAIQLPVWSPALVTALFATNCTEALIAAGLVRCFNDRPSKFDTLGRVLIFLMAGGFAAPFFSSFLDAGVVHVFNGEDYWTVWKMRFLSNILAQLAVVPAVAGILNRAANLSRWPPRCWLEAGGIAAGLVVVSLAVSFDIGRFGLSDAPLAPFLPLLLCTAVRFGSAGVGLSVLGTVLLAVVSTLYGDGLFPALPPDSRIATVQVFLISATMPLLCVGALVEERRRAEAGLRSTDILKSSILNSIPNLVAVIDRRGHIVAVNESWRNAHDRGIASDMPGELGASYLEAWAEATKEDLPYARAAYGGIRSVLEGASPRFILEYCSDSRAGGQWWVMSVVPLRTPEGGAVITHTDITAQKRAEVAAQQNRDEMAHLTRVWVMGELTASLSHQLNQPLTGIMGNAIAGRRFLEVTPPQVSEVRHILTDIIADTQRASDVTRTIREMLRKDEPEPELLDVNDIVRDTTVLVTTEAIIRNVSLRLQLAPSLPRVRGKRVQLRQVVLNLTMNALDAMNGHAASDLKNLIVSTRPRDSGCVELAVIDTGCGLPEGAHEQVFEPFFTTKPSGMGMGLPIARAIVEAHGGTIWADSSSAGDTVFRLNLPASFDQTPP